ncbi:hypothetical protein LCGC14_1609330 [marine sediment metagenome]|uniref:Uncharacterized protein n=1 Tax=marine sediment metagenome TaxID=412755 RepID=A0A0F9L957_9ZZZZ
MLIKNSWIETAIKIIILVLVLVFIIGVVRWSCSNSNLAIEETTKNAHN